LNKIQKEMTKTADGAALLMGAFFASGEKRHKLFHEEFMK